MKKFIISFIISICSLFAIAQMDIPSVGFNPRATISEEVGITSITIKYSRPGVKGREGKIWGGVVANGFSTFSFITGSMTSPWRAGANEATLISFEHDVKIEGKDLKAGSYALFMAMNTDSVLLIFSKQTDAWGSFYYKQSEDVLRVKVKPTSLDKSVEWLKYEFIDHKKESCVIAMQWEKLSIPFRVDVDVDKIVLDRMRSEFTGVKSFISANKLQASMYCFDRNINMEEALSWAQSAVTGKPFGQSGFDAYENLANGYEKLNRLPQADSVMNEGLNIASINQYVGYGKKLITKKRNDRALEVRLGAQKKFGDVYAVNNGLAYAYSAKGDYTRSLMFANKALAQSTSPQSKTTVAANIEKLKAKQDINQ
jgi:tetratricopeptide (TPR) repeat protein